VTRRRALITGGGGFVGQWMTRALLERGDEVTLAGIGGAISGPSVLTRAELASVRWQRTDIRDTDDIRAAVDVSTPDQVIHLAGVAYPPDSDRAPATAYDVNTTGAVRLLTELASRRSSGTLDPSVLVIGTGMQYGRHEAAEMPLTEQADMRPTTPYAASKAAQELASLQIARASGLRVVCTRSFNHSGVGHGHAYLLPSLVRRTLALRGQAAPRRLALGNDVVRDYLHVADVVRAYLLLLDQGERGQVYNVASGRGVSVRELATSVLERAGVEADITTESSLVRPLDIPVLTGSPARLMAATGWTVARSHVDIIDDLLDAQAR